MQKEKEINVNYVISGLAALAFIAWGSIATKNAIINKKESEKAKKEHVISDQKRVTAYNILANNYNILLEENKNQDSIIIENIEIQAELKNKLYNSNSNYNSQNIEYNKAIVMIDSITNVLNTNTKEKSILEKMVKDNDLKINNLETELNKTRNDLLEQQTLSSAQTDTLDIMQKYLNGYFVHRWAIKDKHLENIYLPEGKRFLPTNVKEIREIKALNKEYKNK